MIASLHDRQGREDGCSERRLTTNTTLLNGEAASKYRGLTTNGTESYAKGRQTPTRPGLVGCRRGDPEEIVSAATAHWTVASHAAILLLVVCSGPSLGTAMS